MKCVCTVRSLSLERIPASCRLSELMQIFCRLLFFMFRYIRLFLIMINLNFDFTFIEHC